MLDNLQASDFVDNDANNSTVTFPLIPTGPNKGLEDMSNNEERQHGRGLIEFNVTSGIPSYHWPVSVYGGLAYHSVQE